MTLNARNRRAGLTLIELVAALSILSIGILGTVSLYHFGLDKLKALQESRNALTAAQNELEYLRSLPFDQLVNAADAPFHATAPLEGLVNAQALTSIQDYPGVAGLKQVTVTVAWTGEHGRTVRKSLATLIADKEAP
jgi:prepilin-type N-terminal cleavage/methylation domain-containing protein